MMSKPQQEPPAQLFAQIMQQMTGGFMPSESDGGIIEWFPTETIRPTESLDDGGIIIIGGFPTETIRPMESIHPFEVLI
jgi:hypothetical protein